MFETLTTQPLKIERLTFSYMKPPESRGYEERFNCPVEFSAPRTLIFVCSPGLSTPLETNNDELHEIISQHCLQVLERLPHSGDVESRLRNLFFSSSNNLPDETAAANHLGISKRTLLRRLQNHNLTYGQLKDQFRLDLARQYLDTSHLSVKEISHVLGYSTAAVFCRAFRGWTGTTPSRYRRATIARLISTGSNTVLPRGLKSRGQQAHSALVS